MSTLLKKSPHPALQPFVKAYWFLDFEKGLPQMRSGPPIPEQCMYFYPKSLPIPYTIDGTPIKAYNNIIAGQSLSRYNMIVPDQYCMFKIIFQVGGFYRLFGLPMTLFTDCVEESTLVLGTPIKHLREQIYNANGFAEMVQFTEIFLMNQLGKLKIGTRPIDAVLNQTNLHLFSLDKLASDACLSSRQFERNFMERTGVTPKMYQRIVRFNQAMKLKNQQLNQSWTNITYHVGYFDQNHLLRDFKQFTGEIPSDFDFENAIIH